MSALDAGAGDGLGERRRPAGPGLGLLLSGLGPGIARVDCLVAEESAGRGADMSVQSGWGASPIADAVQVSRLA